MRHQRWVVSTAAVVAMLAVTAAPAASAAKPCPPACETVLTPQTPVDPAAQAPAVVDGGRTVVFIGPNAPGAANGLWSVPVDGSTPPVLLAAGRPGTEGVVGFVTPDSLDPNVSDRIVFLAELTAGDFGLYSVGLGDPTSRRRLDPRLAAHTVDVFGGPHAAPVTITTGGTVVFRMIPAAHSVSSVWMAPIDASHRAVRLSGNHQAWDFFVTPAGDALVYRAHFDPEVALYSVTLDRDVARVRLTPPSDGQVDLNDHSPIFSAEGEWVAFLADIDQPGRIDLMTAEVGAASSVRLIAEGRTFGEGGIGGLSAEGNDVVFLNDPDLPFVNALFSRPFDATDPATRLSTASPQAADGFVWYFELAADRRAVYFGNLNATNRIEMYSAQVGVAASQITLSVAELPAEEDAWVGFPFLSPDQQRVAYVGMLTGATVELYSAPVDEAGAQVQLSDTASDGIQVDYFTFTPDGSHLVYAGSSPTGDPGALFSVAADGATARMQLTAAVVSGGSIRFGPAGIRPTPDGAWVLFVGDLLTDGVNELFAAPLDGSIEALRLSRRTTRVGTEATIIEVLPCGGVYTHNRGGHRWLQLSAVTIPGCAS